MNIQIICVGKIKEKYWNEALFEYGKRLGKYCTISIDEIREERLPENPSEAQMEAVKHEEGKRILGKLKGGTFAVALDIKGKAFSSEELAEKIEMLGLDGKSSMAFIIGGSLGLSTEVLDSSHLRLSFSKMTFPHQMMRVILLEQIYRAFKINRNETYHK
jgi:23S rRNA (pseudouridine1915-N3)-methyltransferase